MANPPIKAPVKGGLKPPPPRKPLPKKPAAKKKAPAKAVRKAARMVKGRKRPSLLRQLMTGIAFIGIVVAALPTAAVLFVGMLPTMCAFMIDRTPRRYATRCVGILNFAGCWPYLLNLWKTGHDMYAAMHILLDPLSWLVIYGAAAAGWLCYLSFPSVAWALMDVFAGRRIAYLRKEQRKLIEDWGDAVAKAPIQPLI
ncbi:MAG TPA: hypothetical protein VFS04_00990 [Alphaproteobacteria bacterium]|nr:hypothetical protein [Alphaproteobacteria bacterium]